VTDTLPVEEDKGSGEKYIPFHEVCVYLLLAEKETNGRMEIQKYLLLGVHCSPVHIGQGWCYDGCPARVLLGDVIPLDVELAETGQFGDSLEINLVNLTFERDKGWAVLDNGDPHSRLVCLVKYETHSYQEHICKTIQRLLQTKMIL